MRRPHFIITSSKRGDFVHTRVELLYRQFLEEVGDREYRNDEDLFDAHLQVIVWGCLYIEGLANYKLLAFARARFPKQAVADAFWETTKFAKLEHKLDLILAADTVIRRGLDPVRKDFSRMEAERNRLVHFKDRPTPIDMPELVAKLGVNAPSSKWSEHTPYPQIVRDLFTTPLPDRLATFLTLGNVLEDVRPG